MCPQAGMSQYSRFPDAVKHHGLDSFPGLGFLQ